MFDRVSHIAIVLVAAAGLTAALPACAAQLEPGQWELTETVLPDGKPEVTADCLSPEDARDPIKTILKDTEGQTCEARNVKETGNNAVVELKCGDPKQTWIGIDMTITFENARHYSGTSKSVVIFRGQKAASESKIDAKWIAAACKK